MPNIGGPELIVVLIIALIVLGPKRLPEVGRSIGKGLREFKQSLSSDDDERDEELADDRDDDELADDRPTHTRQ